MQLRKYSKCPWVWKNRRNSSANGSEKSISEISKLKHNFLGAGWLVHLKRMRQPGKSQKLSQIQQQSSWLMVWQITEIIADPAAKQLIDGYLFVDEEHLWERDSVIHRQNAWNLQFLYSKWFVLWYQINCVKHTKNSLPPHPPLVHQRGSADFWAPLASRLEAMRYADVGDTVQHGCQCMSIHVDVRCIHARIWRC